MNAGYAGCASAFVVSFLDVVIDSLSIFLFIQLYVLIIGYTDAAIGRFDQ